MSERFNYNSMVSSITRSTIKPKDLNKYKLNDGTTNTFYQWNKDEKELGNMCNWLINCAKYYLNDKNDKSTRDLCLKAMDDFIPLYNAEMQGKFNKVFPWGSNWYEFSVVSTNMLFHYIVIDKAKNKELASNLILNIIHNPTKSLGAERKEANAVYMALPWIVAHYIIGDHELQAKDPGYLYVLDYVRMEMVKKRNGEGLYIDCTYITHINVLAYGYLLEMTNMSMPLIAFDNEIHDFIKDCKRCENILVHPNIPYTLPGLFTRATTLKFHTNPSSPYGVKVIPECLFLRMFDKEYSFSVRGQNEWIAYYESDRSNDNMAQYWVLDRSVRFVDCEYSPTFPEVGFIYQKYKNEHSTELITERCRIPSKTTTSTSFINSGITGNHRFVFEIDNIGILRHFFNCSEMKYTSEDSKHGEFSVDELVICDYNDHTVETWMKIQKSYQYDMILQAEISYEWLSSESSMGIFHILWNCKTRTLISDFNCTDVGTIEEKYPIGFHIVDTNNTVMLIKDDNPVLAMYPDKIQTIDTSFDTKYNNETIKFSYNEKNNQYSRMNYYRKWGQI